MDVDRISTAIYDEDQSSASQDLMQMFRGSRYFTVVDAKSYEDIEELVLRDEILLGVVIPTDYATKTQAGPSGEGAQVQFLLDGSDSNTASLALGYAEGLVRNHAKTLADANANLQGARPTTPIEPLVRIWYNNDLKSRNYIVPGLIAVILMIIAALLTSLTIAREWENGTMEQLLSTPVRPVELLLGKLAAYFVLGVVDMLLSLALAVFVMRIPFRGSVLLLFLAGCLFLIGALCWGLLISAATRSQSKSYQIATLSSFLPAFLLSGFIYATENMPAVIQAVTYIIPARYFVTLLKGIFLKGVGLEVLWGEFLFLSGYAAIVFFIATRKMRQKVA
jgi:ABC-2 type transport system permease protein